VKNYLLFAFFLSFTVHAQDAPLWKKTLPFRRLSGGTIPTHSILPGKPNTHHQLPENARPLILEPGFLSSLQTQKPEFLQLELPFQHKIVRVHLVRTVSLEKNTEILNSTGSPISWKPGLYYHGVIEGNPKSLVAFSFFDNDVTGLVSSPELGDWCVAKRLGSNDLYLYPKSVKEMESVLKCSYQPSSEPSESGPVSPAGIQTTTDKIVKIYYELDPNVYNGNGQSTNATLNWLSALHHNLKTVYFNHGIQIHWNSTRIWQTALPFIPEFLPYMTARPSFNGDLAAFISYNGANGVAGGVGNLCNSRNDQYIGIGPHCLNFIAQHFDSLPANSITLSICAHEIGHLLGSPHTHDCVWNGNNTQIDDCGNANPFPGTSPGACYDSANAILPIFEGTIMGYCPMIIANGFGPQPAERMRQKINSFPCIPETGDKECFPSLDSLVVLKVKGTSARLKLYDSDTSHKKWLVRIGDFSNPSPWDTIRTSEFTINGLSLGGGNYWIQVKTLCPAPLDGNFIVLNIVKTEPNYCETLFDDGDDMFPGYQPGNKDYIMYPATSGRKVKINFQFCVLFPKDTLSIYNGDTAAGTPIAFKIGADGPNPDAISTDTSGALTVSLRSGFDFSSFATGWMANVTCVLPTRVNDLIAPDANRLFPNPVQQVFQIRSDPMPTEFRILNVLGETLNGLRPTERNEYTGMATFSVVDLPAGAYSIHATGWSKPIWFVKL